MMSTLIKLGKPGMAKVKLFCKIALSIFTEEDSCEDIPEEYLDVMCGLFTCWRGTLTILDAEDITGMEEAEELYAAKTSSTSGPARMVSMVMHNVRLRLQIEASATNCPRHSNNRQANEFDVALTPVVVKIAFSSEVPLGQSSSLKALFHIFLTSRR